MKQNNLRDKLSSGASLLRRLVFLVAAVLSTSDSILQKKVTGRIVDTAGELVIGTLTRVGEKGRSPKPLNNAFEALNPRDIESIGIFKDASPIKSSDIETCHRGSNGLLRPILPVALYGVSVMKDER